MKKNFTLLFFTVLFTSLYFSPRSNAQCPALGGYTAAELNWDNLDFLPSNNARYSPYYLTPAFPYNQNFAMGTRRLNLTMAPQANITLNGENGTNTAHAGSFATAGDDIQFTTTATANTTVAMTFDADVANVMFSIFDLDNNQRIVITAMNAGGTAQNITVVRASGTSGITIGGSGTTSATATGPNGTNYLNNDNRGSINVTINGPINRVTLTCSNAVGDFWLSDIDACITGTFPNGYQAVSRPFTGQPQYVIAVVNNNVYYLDPLSGKAYFLFNEPGHDRLNSLAYDPYRRVVYYTYSLTDRVGLDPEDDRVLKRYDVDSKTISVVLNDVRTVGIPTYESGVESGAASFYNGSLYLGVEGYTGANYAASRKSTIWKLDFDALGNAVGPASQVFGVTADNGSAAQNIHDWSDFAVTNGRLIDFDGSQSGDVDFYHFDLMTGANTNYIPAGTLVPRQTSIGWDERVYNVDASISLYNGTTSVGTLVPIFSPLGPTIPIGSSNASWGDAAGPYRPFLDFGDAPASYDPDPWSPACHDTLTPTIGGTRRRMQLGAAEDVEWLKRGFTTVEDNFEDGLPFVPIFSPSSNNYLAQLTVLNNTDSAATVCAWLDYNGNGIFDASESITPITVTPSPTPQNISLFWPSTPSMLSTGSFTYLRIRITNVSRGMGANNATGYYNMGEVEDYRVIIDDNVLSVTLTSFDARLVGNNEVKLNWTVNEEAGFDGYQVQRSFNGTDWQHVTYIQSPHHAGGVQQYQLTDNNTHIGTTSYRLKLVETDGRSKYSHIRVIRITDLATAIKLFPNPAREEASLSIIGNFRDDIAHVRITSADGNEMSYQKIPLIAGTNTIKLPIQPSWPGGMYFVRVTTNNMITNKQLFLKK